MSSQKPSHQPWTQLYRALGQRLKLRLPRRRPLEGWERNLLACWVVQFLCIAGFSAAFPFLPFYVRELGARPDQVEMWSGVIIAAGSVAMALVAPIWGLLADRHGRKLMVIRSTFGGAFVLVLIAFAGSVHHLFILRILQGMLTGTVPAFMTLTASYAPRERVGFALGAMQMAVFSGSSVGPLLGGFVADHLGYRVAFLVTSVFLLIAGLLSIFLIKESFQPPDPKKQRVGMRDAVAFISGSLPVVGAMIALGAMYTGANAPVPILPLFVESLQQNSSFLGTNTGLVHGSRALASALAAIVIGRLADRAGYRKVMIACGLLAGLAFLAQGFSPTIGVLVITSFAGGLAVGGVLPTANALLARLVPREQQGTVFGLSTSINSFGGALGPILGAAAASLWSLRASFLITAMLFGLMTAWVAAVIPPASQRQKQARG